MDSLLTDLTLTMSLITELYEELLLVIEEEKQAMFKWDMNAVTTCSNNKEKLFVRLVSCEKKRIMQAGLIAEKYELPKDSPLSLLAEKVAGNYGDKLRENRIKLLSLASNVKHKNSVNANMSSRTGVFLSKLMLGIANELKPTNTYSRNGVVKKSGYASVFNKSF